MLKNNNTDMTSGITFNKQSSNIESFDKINLLLNA